MSHEDTFHHLKIAECEAPNMKVKQAAMGNFTAVATRRIAGLLSAAHGSCSNRSSLLLRAPSSTSSAFSTTAAVDGDAAATHKYENVRKLIVGLGNPGEKFAKTRYVSL